MSSSSGPSPAWRDAAAFAARAHAGQVRKDGITPYVSHCFRVAMTLRDGFGCDDPVLLCTALLHDTIEDTTTDFDNLASGFGDEVAEAVAVLTKDMRLPYARREEAYWQGLREASAGIRLVKLADILDNLLDAPSSAGQVRAAHHARRALDELVEPGDPAHDRAREALLLALAPAAP